MVKQNLIIYSEQLGNASGWTFYSSSVTANQALSPIALGGNMTAAKVADINTNAVHGLYNALYSFKKGRTYTFSAYLKNGDINFGGLYVDLGAGSAAVQLNLNTGVITSIIYSGNASFATGTSTNAGNGWWKVTLTFQIANDVNAYPIIILSFNGSIFSYTGSGKFLYATGAQMVQANWEGDYILTTASRINDGNPPRNKVITRGAVSNRKNKGTRPAISNRKNS